MQSASVQPEHLLLALSKEAKGISLKLFKMYDVNYDKLQKAVDERLRFEKSAKHVLKPPFSTGFKDLLKCTTDLAAQSENGYILFEHLFLAVISDEKSYCVRILKEFYFDIEQAKDLLKRLVQRKIKRLPHPEIEEEPEKERFSMAANHFFEGKESSAIFEKAVKQLALTQYEMLGTEQILAAILSDGDSETAKILRQNGIYPETFENKLKEPYFRDAEFEKGQVLLTPSALSAMLNAVETAKELGSSEVSAAHIVLGILKTKQGAAYNLLNYLKTTSANLQDILMKPLEQQMSEGLMVMRFAKQETLRFERKIMGTEMILLGILDDAGSIGARVLTELEVSAKDMRNAIETLVGYGEEYIEGEITLTQRAKKVLETAWMLAKQNNHDKIKSEHLLFAITTLPESVAMKALAQLGVDAVEIRQGIARIASQND